MKKSFLIYQEWEELFDALSDTEAGKLIKAMLDHAKGEKPKLPQRLSLVFIQIRQQLDRNLENYERVSKINSENAKKRWKPGRLGTKLSNRMRSYTNADDKDKDKDKDINNKKKSILPKAVNEDYLSAAKKYHVGEDQASEIFEDLKLYCKQNEKTYKNYLAAYENFIRRAIKNGQIQQPKTWIQKAQEENPDIPDLRNRIK